MKGITY